LPGEGPGRHTTASIAVRRDPAPRFSGRALRGFADATPINAQVASIRPFIAHRQEPRRVDPHKLGVQGRSEAVEIIEQLGLGSTDAKVPIPDQDLD
jgi:hypothetical protein